MTRDRRCLRTPLAQSQPLKPSEPPELQLITQGRSTEGVAAFFFPRQKIGVFTC